MAILVDPSIIYPVVSTSASEIPIGTICYRSMGLVGTPKGLLLSLTLTPLYKKVIQTINGFQGVA
jgi:hypothetical protein